MVKWLNVYKDEIRLFVWSLALLFLIRCSCMIFSNFAETAFLKRYGVEYLPIVYMINSIATFVLMGLMAGVMANVSGTRLLTWLLVFCGVTVAVLRGILPMGIELLYPLLYILNTQYEVVLILIFWNLGNDLFNTRQSKRIFPLITAGGVIGRIAGSFGTPLFVKAVSLDNLMLVYLGFTLVAAFLAWRMGKEFPTLLLSRRPEKKVPGRPSILRELREMIPIMKESTLFKLFIFLTLLPNMVIPILNYQFNVAVNQTFASEGGMIQFFSFFRGGINIVTLIILLFVGRVYSRWGLPLVLMFHPLNYLVVFMAFFFQMNVLVAMYARLSTTIIRTTMNAPVTSILMGLFPETYRSRVRPFLRGTVVRVGTLAGSGMILMAQNYVDPRYLSIPALVCVGGWLVATFVLKREYPAILLDLISRDQLDFRSMGNNEIHQIFKDSKARAQIEEQFLKARGSDAVWYAELLRDQGLEKLDDLILSVLRKHEPGIQQELMPFLSAETGDRAVAVVRMIADNKDRNLMISIITLINRLPLSDQVRDFRAELLAKAEDSIVQAHALAGMMVQEPGVVRQRIMDWLESAHIPDQRAGIIAAGLSGDTWFTDRLELLLKTDPAPQLLPDLLTGLHRLGAGRIEADIRPYLIHKDMAVRLAALTLFTISSDDDMVHVLKMLNDPDDKVRELALETILDSTYQNPLLLVKSLSLPQRKIREGIFQLLEQLNIRDLDIYRYARAEVQQAYRYLSEFKALEVLPESPERDLLAEHLGQKKDRCMEQVLRVISAQDRTGRMRIVLHAIASDDARQRSNSMEVLEELTDGSLSGIIMPLLEDMTVEEKLAKGKKRFKLPDIDSTPGSVASTLLGSSDWVTIVLMLGLLRKKAISGVDRSRISALTGSDNSHVRQMALEVMTAYGN